MSVVHRFLNHTERILFSMQIFLRFLYLLLCVQGETGQRKNKKLINQLLFIIKWSGKRDSNSRPSGWQPDALPTELLPRSMLIIRFLQRCQENFISCEHLSCAPFLRPV